MARKPKVNYEGHPIELAVRPLRERAIQFARDQATKTIAHICEKLAEADWDANAVAPYPERSMSTNQWRAAEHKYKLYRSIVEVDYDRQESSGLRHGHIGDPQFVKYNTVKGARFIEEIEKIASLQYEAYVAKLIAKIGETVTEVILTGTDVWWQSWLDVKFSDGRTERWQTKTIENQSKYGLRFHQWPTRKVK